MLTRTDRRRFAVIAALAMAMLFSPVQAQEGSAPDKPTGLSAAATDGQVVLTWDDPEDDSITGYVILRRVRVNNTGGEFSELVADTGTAATTYTDDSVQANTTYTYRIKATNEHGVSERSRWFHIDTPAAPVPDKPRGLDATATHDSVTLTWNDPNDDSITGYVILRRIPGVDPEGQFSELVSNTGTDATTYTDDTVSAETRYTYRIKAMNEYGVSERSRWSHIDTPEAPVPDQSTGLSAAATHGSVTLTWDDPGDDSITGYVVLRRVRVNDTGGDFDVLLANTETAALTYTDDTVAAGLTYTYRIKAINEYGVSERSRWVHINTPAALEAVEDDDPDGKDDDDGAPGGPGKRDNVSEPSGDDCPDDNITTCEVDVGGSVTGNTAQALDRDWFKVVLEAGKRYQFDVEGDDTDRGTLADPYFWGLYDSGGSSISGVRSDGGGVGKNGRDTYTPSTGGSYYIAASSGQGTTGTYTLSVIVLGANGNSEADTDFPRNTTTTGRVDVGASATGNIEDNTDTDWFRVDLEAGKVYQIDMEGADTDRGTLSDPRLRLYDAGGVVYVASDIDGGDGKNARLTYAPTTSARYFISASRGPAGGTYTLSVRDVTPPPEDLPADTTTTGRVEVNGLAVRGAIDAPAFVEYNNRPGYDFDTDWFAVELKEGRTYRIDMKGRILRSPGLDMPGVPVDPELTLSLPQINAIYDADGDYLLNTWGADESSAHHLFRVTFHAHDDGTYYIAASGESFESGGYELRVIDITEDPD